MVYLLSRKKAFEKTPYTIKIDKQNHIKDTKLKIWYDKDALSLLYKTRKWARI